MVAWINFRSNREYYTSGSLIKEEAPLSEVREWLHKMGLKNIVVKCRFGRTIQMVKNFFMTNFARSYNALKPCEGKANMYDTVFQKELPTFK